MKAFDARCTNCDGVHIVWIAWDHEVGDRINIAHARTPGSCREYCEHELLRQLDGLSDKEKWGPDASNTQPTA